MLKHKYKLVFSSLVLIVLFFNVSVFAAPPPFGCPGGPTGPGAPASCPYTQQQVEGYCANPATLPQGQSLYCSNGGSGNVLTEGTGPSASTPNNAPAGANFQGDCKENTVNASNCGIVTYLLTAINALSAIVGVVVVIMIVVGGIQYSAARDNPQMVSAARDRIRNAIFALIAYLFIYALLQYLVPGGIL